VDTLARKGTGYAIAAYGIYFGAPLLFILSALAAAHFILSIIN
jgi:hypothetical protein